MWVKKLQMCFSNLLDVFIEHALYLWHLAYTLLQKELKEYFEVSIDKFISILVY